MTQQRLQWARIARRHVLALAVTAIAWAAPAGIGALGSGRAVADSHDAQLDAAHLHLLLALRNNTELFPPHR